MTIWKQACVVHVWAVIHYYQGVGASCSKKCHPWKDCIGNNDLTSLTSTFARGVARTSARRLGHLGPVFFLNEQICLPSLVIPSFSESVMQLDKIQFWSIPWSITYQYNTKGIADWRLNPTVITWQNCQQPATFTCGYDLNSSESSVDIVSIGISGFR